MTRRRFVALVSASVILGIVLVIVGAVLAITQTGFGRERIRRLVLARAVSSLGKRGTLFIGRVSGSLFTELVVDSISLRDAEDSLVIATGPIRVRFDPRDLIDQRIHLHTLDVTRPVIYLRRHANDVWNYRTLFPAGPKRAPRRTRGLGDYIVADTVALRDGTFWLTEPWGPDDSLKGARRDSAVRSALAQPRPEVRMTKEGPTRTRRWTHLEIRAPWVRIAQPDSVGQLIRLDTLSTVLSDPPVALRNLRGTVRIHGDSVWASLSHFELPATAGHAEARIWWGGNKPVQLDVNAETDSISLRDFNWVYARLPRAGGGRSEVHVRNDPKNLRAIDYALKKLDLRTANSHLRGDLTIGAGWPVLVIKDVDLALEPADFDLLRAFNGGDLGVDFRGRFTGHVVAAGGPIDRWRVDSATLSFADAHVPGAVSRLTLRGELDLRSPANAVFHGVDLGLDALDLRTITYLFPAFPRLGGTMTGHATLDSIWTDVRFRDADLTHLDGPEAPSRVTGSGRVTSGGRSTIFDVTLDAAPLSFTSLARSFPSLPLRGSFSGPLRVQGIADRLALATRLAGAAGTLAIDELIDMDSAGGEGARGTVRAEAVDIALALGRPELPATRLFAAIVNDVHGDALATMEGALAVTVDTSSVARIWIRHATARVAVAGGHLRVDSLTVGSTGVRMRGSGMLGVAAGARDTLRFAADVDSIGGLRSLFTGERTAAAPVDSLGGELSVAGFLAGSIADSFTARGTFTGTRLVAGGATAVRLIGGFDIAGLPRAPGGTIWTRSDSATIAGVGIDTLTTSLVLRGRNAGALTLAIATDRPAGTVRGGGRIAYETAGDTLRLTLDSLDAAVEGHAWRIAAPAHFTRTPGGDVLDSLVIRAGGGRIAAHGDLPTAGDVHGLAVVDSLSLGDLGALLQSSNPLAGLVGGDLRLSGTRGAPVMRLAARFRDAKFGSFGFAYFGVDADYSERRLVTRIDFFDRGQAIATLALTVPADFTLRPVAERFPIAPISGRLTADSVNLNALALFSTHLSQPAGTASADLAISGTRRQPLFAGHAAVKDGEVGLPRFGVRLTAIQAAVRFAPDGLHIDTLSMRSGSASRNFLSLTGTLLAPSLLALRDDRSALEFDLKMRARNFQLIDSRRLARVEVTDSVTLRGKFASATLSGRIDLDKADFYLSGFERKSTVVDLDDPELFADPAMTGNRELGLMVPADVRAAISALRVEGLDVMIGDQVWLRSQQSEIKLGGAVQITGSGTQRLTGRIDVRRGAYRLDLGLVQRTFQVDSGHVSFYGDVEAGGQLDVWASSTVRQANRQGEDVKILAHITGTTNTPHADFSSGERYALSDSEILSYLIFGQPNFGGANDVQSRNALTSALLPSLGTVMEGALSSQLRWVDQVMIQTGATTTPQNEPNAQNSALYGSRFGFGKQLGDRTYVAANAGLCWLQSASSSSTSFSQSLGVSIEQRLGDRFFLQASMEPSSAALLCKPGSTPSGNRPQQFGFDLFREWSF